jgi:uncharacterized protein
MKFGSLRTKASLTKVLGSPRRLGQTFVRELLRFGISDAGKPASIRFSGLERLAAGALGLILVFSASPVLAYSSPGTPTGYVNDFAHVLSAETVQDLDAELLQFEASTSNQIAVVTVPDMGGDYVENYAVKLFADWGIGKKDKDNGVLLLLSIQEHKIRIEVGYGLEGALPDSVAQSIINNDLTPNLKAGDFDGGVTQAVHDIEAATQNEYTGTGSTDSGSGGGIDYGTIVYVVLIFLMWGGSILARSKSWWGGGIVGAVLGFGLWGFLGTAIIWGLGLVAGLALLGTIFDFIVSRTFANSKASGMRPPWWIGGGGFGGRGGGGGFGGFGGGSSGGGGASGGW